MTSSNYVLSALTLSAVLLLLACGERTSTLEALREREITMPDGKKIVAEVMMSATDLQRGMMFRDAMPKDTGMLFIHNRPGNYSYWMYQVKVPLDIVWLDTGKRVIRISADTPPCTTRASDCPRYGGQEPSQYVLELPARDAQRLGLTIGSVLRF